MKTIKMILGGIALSMLAAPVSADMTDELTGCRNLEDLGKKTVVQFDSAYRLMDFCSDQAIELILMSNPSHWQVSESTPPNIEGVRGFFTVQPTIGADSPYANNVIIYLEDGTRRELWLKMLEKKSLLKGVSETFLDAYGKETSSENSDTSKKSSFMSAHKKEINIGNDGS